MASEIHMPAPVCLIENTEGQLVANQEALEILSGTKNPLVVVAIVGLYRTGKSYLMNKLAGKNKGEWLQKAPPSPFCPPTLRALNVVMQGQEVRERGGILKVIF